jgi:hypothetical protein
MTRGPEDHIFGATAGCVILATGAAFVLIIYAMLTIFALLPPASTQGLVRLTY